MRVRKAEGIADARMKRAAGRMRKRTKRLFEGRIGGGICPLPSRSVGLSGPCGTIIPISIS